MSHLLEVTHALSINQSGAIPYIHAHSSLIPYSSLSL